MRFMLIVKPPAALEGAVPQAAEFAAMGRYNEELQRAGVLLELNGLKPTAAGARVRFHGPKRTVLDGPFTEAKELIAGYTIIEVRSREEAIEWAKRAPFSTEVHPDAEIEVEIRQLMDLDDLPPERAAAKTQFERRDPG